MYNNKGYSVIKILIIIICVTLVIVVAYTMRTLLSDRIAEVFSAETPEAEDEQKAENDIYDTTDIDPAEDPEAYFKNNSQLIDSIPADESEDTTTEEETVRLLRDRGFGDIAISSTYTMDGTYIETDEISDSSYETHPTYEALYQASSGDIWCIYLYNGQLMANPLSYNEQSTEAVLTIISESDTVTSYSSATNTFYVNIPDESQLIVKQIPKISASALDALTVEEIASL